jgi:Amt family ammonium transporter
MLGGVSGAVAGLVGITPACGFVGPMGALVIGIAAGVICFWAVASLKNMLGYDDALDAFGVHAIGGIIGAILTGVFAAPKLGGSGVFDYAANKVGDFDMGAQIVSQLWGVGTAIVWSGVVSLVLFKLVDMVMGLRVKEEAEREGLDVAEHGEKAYNP